MIFICIALSVSSLQRCLQAFTFLPHIEFLVTDAQSNMMDHPMTSNDLLFLACLWSITLRIDVGHVL